MRQGIRCLALALISAAAISFGAQSASAGLLDGGYGCGCGGYGYVQTYAAPMPYIVEQTRTVVRRTYVVDQTGFGYGPTATVGYGYGGYGGGWYHHHHFGHYGWRHHF